MAGGAEVAGAEVATGAAAEVGATVGLATGIVGAWGVPEIVVVTGAMVVWYWT